MIKYTAIVLFISLAAAASSIQGPENAQRKPASDVYPSSSLNLVKLGNKNYFFDVAQPMNWMDARSFCRDYGMDLVSVETEAENSLLKEYMSSGSIPKYEFWTSGNNIGHDTYKWLNGEELGSWVEFTPSATYMNEHCLVINYYIWADSKCTNSDTNYHFICESR